MASQPQGKLGALLDEELRRHNTTANKLATEIGISSTHIYRLLRGESTNPSDEVLEKIARGLRIPVDDLIRASVADRAERLGVSDTEDEWGAFARRVAAQAAGLDPEVQARVREVATAVMDGLIPHAADWFGAISGEGEITASSLTEVVRALDKAGLEVVKKSSPTTAHRAKEG